MYGICDTILKINPLAQVSVIEEDLDQITWHNGTAEISKADIQAKQAELQAEYDAKQYQRDRKPEYPTIEECVHAILDGELDDLQIKRQAVKDKYPKEI
jgi:hypothetical protein